MIGKYIAEELKPDFNRQDEELRLHNILTDLFERSAQGEFISEAEKEFICMFLKTAQGDVPPFNTAEICSSFKFKLRYLIYGHDLTGGSKYYKPYGLEIKEIPIGEAAAELEILRQEGKEWGEKLADNTTTDPLLLAAAHEYEFEMGQVNAQSPEYQANFMFGGRRIYDLKLLGTQLRNKFIYYAAKEVFENFDNQQLTLILNGKAITINEQSIVHITNRHFAETIKQHASPKSFHNENFHPKLLNKQLQVIFQEIEAAGGLKAPTLGTINFSYKGEIYRVYTTDRPNKTGDVFLSTFFILEDPKQLQKLTEDYDCVQLSADLSVYQPK